jgi:superoxide reductase
MATESLQVYKCDVCGIVAEVLDGGAGELVCCGQPMRRLAENAADASREKHLPVVTQVEGGFQVTVGSVAHPMEPKHFIMWIELLAGGKAYRQFLHPGEKPEAFFPMQASPGEVWARELCNLHGLWKVGARV